MEKIGKRISSIHIICIVFFSIISPITYSVDQPLNDNIFPLGNLEFFPKSYDFGNIIEGEIYSTNFQIWRGGGCCGLEYSIFSECEFIEVFPSSGTSHGEHDDISIYVDTTGLDPGHYSCNINISSNSGNGVFVINFTIFILYWPDINCEANLHWLDVKTGSELQGIIYIMNEGDPGSLLDWMIISYPEWGFWNFSAESGFDITPEDPAKKIDLNVIAPDDRGSEFYGDITIVNKHNFSDLCIINVSISTSKIKSLNNCLFNFLQYNPFLPDLHNYMIKIKKCI